MSPRAPWVVGVGIAAAALCAAGLAASAPPPPSPDAPTLTPSPLALATLAAARRTVGVRESAHNAGREINAWLERLGFGPGENWCAAWLSAMVDEGARTAGVLVPFQSARAKAWMEWAERRGRFVPASAYRLGAAALRPGLVPVFDRGGARGHIGIAERVISRATWLDLEGNAGPRGDAVAEVERSVDDPQFLGMVLL